MTATHSPLRFPLILIGFMGAGKTVVGWHLARRLGLRFLDLDQEIERRAGCAVADIFRAAGEAHFRHLEAALLAEILRRPPAPLLLATGGGVVEDPANRALLAETGTVIFLDPPFKVLVGRIRLAGLGRPLADGVEERVLRDRWRRRRPLYREVATLTVGGALPLESLVQRLAERLCPSA